MDSAGLYVCTKNFAHLTAEEAKSLEQLSENHPYCQLIRLLHSRAAQDLRYPNKADLLGMSAVYSTDRSVLKYVMSAPQPERSEDVAIVKEIGAEKTPDIAVLPAPALETKSTVAEAQIPAPVTTTLSDDALIDDIYLQLEKLKKSKHDFELSLEEFQKVNPVHGPGAEVKPKIRGAKEASDPLLEEIKSNKKKLKVDSPKQKEQNEIIDQFIKTQPIIPKAKPTAPASDLSEESSVFSDSIVSETLVGILLKQGKKEKAIEVLKKLIWKFPQKKAYFAAQIEDLKN